MKDEIDTGRKRRSFGRAFKRQVVEETLVPGASVSGVALRPGLNNSMVCKWRREYLRWRAPVGEATLFQVSHAYQQATDWHKNIRRCLRHSFLLRARRALASQTLEPSAAERPRRRFSPEPRRVA
jgi:transposase-like protein